MEAIFHTASELHDIFNGMSDLIPTVRLDVSKHGIQMNCVGQHGVSFVNLLLSMDYFKYFTVDEDDKTHILILDLKFVLKVVSKFQKDNEVCLKYNGLDNYITLIQNNTVFKVTMVDKEFDDMRAPEPDLVGDVFVDSHELKDFIETLQLYTETCAITILKNKKEFIMSGKGVYGEGHRIFKIESNCGKGSSIRTTTTNYFPTSYLIKFLKSYKLSSTVRVGIVENQPIMLHFQISNQSYLRYYVSPKVPDETDSAQAMQFVDAENGGDDKEEEHTDEPITDESDYEEVDDDDDSE